MNNISSLYGCKYMIYLKNTQQTLMKMKLTDSLMLTVSCFFLFTLVNQIAKNIWQLIIVSNVNHEICLLVDSYIFINILYV